MSNESEKLFDGVTNISDEVIGKAQKKQRRRWYRWAGPVAAVLAAAILIGVISGRSGMNAYAIAEAEYPKGDTWVGWSSYAGTLDGFLTKSIPQFLSGAGEENRVYSPLNVYMALSMLAEVTDGNTRAQILDLLGVEDLGTQRERANAIWRNAYTDDKAKCLLGSSLWLNQEINFVQSTMDTLAESYYASSYRGEMGSERFTKALQTWLNERTGGLLQEQTEGVTLPADTVMAIAATLYFKDGWSAEFDKSATAPDLFHAPGGERTVDFMHKTRVTGNYYRGERFGAVVWGFKGHDAMWFILPDEGFSPDELLADAEFLTFLCTGGSPWENSRRVYLNLSIPKFDVVSDVDLRSGLIALGITDAMDPAVSDYTPMTRDTDDVYLSKVLHAARVKIDEEGCEAAAYTVEYTSNTAAPMAPEEEIDFVLDRPVLFAITGNDGLPLFVGVVNVP